MYCNGCGQLLQLNQTVCDKCGKPVVAVPAPTLYGIAPVRRRGVSPETLGMLWIGYAAWTVMQAIIAATVLNGIFGHRFDFEPWSMGNHYAPNMSWLIPVIITATIGRVILSVVTGIALMRRAPWSRVLAIVTGFLTLIKPIVGTVLAIYTLWVLLPAASAREFEEFGVR
jgi:hypothetical protein